MVWTHNINFKFPNKMRTWRDVLCDVLSEVELSSSSVYALCFSRKVEFISQLPERCTTFALDEKASQIVLLTTETSRSTGQRSLKKRTLILTPLPTLRVTSLLLSVDGNLMAILTRTSVHVLDANCRITPESDESTPIVKRIYCAFDCIDHIPPEKNRFELLRVRWHPRIRDMLVILTTDSRIFFVQCSKLSGTGGLGCCMRFQLNLGNFQRCVADVAAYSDTENLSVPSSDDENEINSSNHSYSKLDLEHALGGGCVDFDFGAPILRHSTKWRFDKDQALDCCLYLLCESGYIIQVSGCLSATRNPATLNIQTLVILPPSSDNYGDEFCALLSFSSSHRFDTPDVITPTEAPPDVLVLANRSGRIYQGVVLQNKRPGATVSSPALCLVDVVDLHLHDRYEANHTTGEDESLRCGYTQQSSASQSPSPEVSETKGDWATLVLEPARLIMDSESDPVFSLPLQLGANTESYPYQAYYVIHDAGLHLVRLPWLENISQWCRKLIEDPLMCINSNSVPDAGITPKRVKDWQSSVQHLICAKLPVISAEGSAFTDGQFRICGLMEIPLDLTYVTEEPYKHRCPGSAGTLLVVRAPDQAHKDDRKNASLLIPIPIECKRSQPFRSEEADKTQSNFSNAYLNAESQSKIRAKKSEFQLHLKRLLDSDSSSLPMITGLSTQTNLTQIQLVQFFMKATELLRSGPLERLTRARIFVEQYTSRLTDHLSVQYQEAMKLVETRQVLQQNAERMTKQHAVLLERQQQLDKRLALVVCRLAGLCNGPTKIDVGMHDEVVAIRDRLRKGLLKWSASLRSRHALLEERMARLHSTRPGAGRPSSSIHSTMADSLSDCSQAGDAEAELRRVSYWIKQEAAEIKHLVDSIKLLNVKFSSLSA